MRMCYWVMTGLLALLLSLPAAAAEYHVGSSAPAGTNTYANLNELNTLVNLHPGDTIILYNHDNSLSTALNWSDFTIRSAGNSPFIVSSAGSLTIGQGKGHFGENITWQSGGLHVGRDAVFKPSVGLDLQAMQYSASVFSVDSFTADPGARLEIGNISTAPGNLVFNPASMVLVIGADPGVSNFADVLRINNALMEAYFTPNPTGTAYDLTISRVNDLSTLDGVDSYADAYRLSDVSDLERDMLDSIYARGGTDADKGFLQTVGGVIVQNSLLSVREHNNNIVTQINRRLTNYQDEELANIPGSLDASTDPLAIGSSGLCATDYDEEDEYESLNSYNETWAFLDHGRSSQEDHRSDAAYRMNTTTLGIGHDWHQDQWIYGGMLSYATGAMKLENQSATKNEYDFLTAAAYISWAEDGWYLSGVGTATYGWNSAHSSYTLPGVTLGGDADFATSALGLALEAGHMLETELYGVPLRITPYGSLAYTLMSRDSVSETGAQNAALDINLNKHFRSMDWNTWDAALGVRLAVPMRVEGMTIMPAVDLSYSRSTGQRTPEGGTVRMYDNPASAWDIGLMDANRNALRMAAGVQAEIRENVTLGAAYEFEWRKQYWNNRFNINVSMDF